jgi:hypothetical protein
MPPSLGEGGGGVEVKIEPACSFDKLVPIYQTKTRFHGGNRKSYTTVSDITILLQRSV